MSKMLWRQRKLRCLSKMQLIRLRTEAMRSGVWLRELQRVDRALVNNPMKVARSVRSKTSAPCILAIKCKVQKLTKKRISQAIGSPAAHRLSARAQKWGYKTAHQWKTDVGFAQHLTIMNISGHSLKAKCERRETQSWKIMRGNRANSKLQITASMQWTFSHSKPPAFASEGFGA
jgi:hypothetical protein